jgi:hypothetical protein
LTAYQKGDPTLPIVTVQFSDPVPPGAPLLLAPLFPDAFGYRLDSFEVEHAEVVDQLRTTNSSQEDYIIRQTAAPMRPVLHYRLEAFDGEAPTRGVYQPGWAAAGQGPHAMHHAIEHELPARTAWRRRMWSKSEICD